MNYRLLTGDFDGDGDWDIRVPDDANVRPHLSLPLDFREHIRRVARGADSILEVGPSYDPIAPKAAGFPATTFDHCDRAALVEKYRHHPVDISKIEDVDVVGTDLRALEGRQFSCIIASHLIEHTPDLIGFLNTCSSLLADRGRLLLIVPDKRYCFDRNRPVTTTGQVLDAHHLKRERHVGAVFDQYTSAVSLAGVSAWGAGASGPLKPIHTFEEAAAAYKRAADHPEYADAHEWVFTPSTFRLVVQDVGRLERIDLFEDEFCPSIGCEFFASLSRGSRPATWNREALVAEAARELAELASEPVADGERQWANELSQRPRELEEIRRYRIPGEQRLRALIARLGGR